MLFQTKLKNVIILAIVICLCLPTVTNAKRKEIRKATSEEVSMQVGLSLPTIGFAKNNDKDEITGYHGFNYFLGYSSTYFFEPLEINTWNNYYHWGTVLFVIPYIGIGSEYQGENGFFASIQTVYFVPWFQMGFRF